MKRIGLVGLILATLFAIVPRSAAAAVNDFVIHDFQTRYQLFNDVHGGRMQARETIKLTFSDQNHGILRAIPLSYKDQPLRLKTTSIKRDGQTEKYTTYKQNDNEVLKIGDANRTITGDHTYEISYEMRNIISFASDKDEWYWDINGDQWNQMFERVSGEVIFPDNWNDVGLPAASCYTGPNKSTAQACSIRRTVHGYTFVTTGQLSPRQTLTVAVASPKRIFQPRDRADWYRENAWQFVGLAVGVFISFWCAARWWKHGRDYKGRGTIIPEYEPPQGLTPAEAGMLLDYRLDGRDLTATIIDLAVRGYIKIHDDEKKTLGVFSHHEYSLELVKDDFLALKEHERSLLNALFKPAKMGTIQAMATINKTAMYKEVTSIRRQLKRSLIKEHGLIEDKPEHIQAQLIVLIIVLFIALFVAKPGWGWIVGFGVAICSASIFTFLMKRRSHAGVEAYEAIKGLKLYINTADKHRLEKMQSVDRPFAPPEKTVNLFEKLLPFAVALGIERSWAKQFEGAYQQPPGWYDGNFSSFHMVHFASALGSSVSALNSSFTQSSSSGSSGSGGGGFSGGGGGGGGGGGW